MEINQIYSIDGMSSEEKVRFVISLVQRMVHAHDDAYILKRLADAGIENTAYASRLLEQAKKNVHSDLVRALTQLRVVRDFSVTMHTNPEYQNIQEELRFFEFCQRHFHHSRSQTFQDLFVLYWLREKRNGFFVEYGAASGLALSNTYLLETEYGWQGILSEPSRMWHEVLRKNRRCHIDTHCVWSKTGEELLFNEVGEYSTIDRFSNGDILARMRAHSSTGKYPVTTLSLNDLLDRYDAPRHIDYMSIDTEGSELTILEAFDFNRYHIELMTVEHGFKADRERIYALLVKNGFRRILETFSHQDDWFIRA